MSFRLRSRVAQSVTGRNVVQSLSTTAIVMILGLVSGIVAARALGVNGRGELAAVILWPAVLTSLVELGFPTAFTYLAASQEHTRYDLARSVVPLTLAQSVLVDLIGVPTVLVALSGYSDYIRATAVGFIVLYAPLFLGARYLIALNQGAGRISVMNLARLLVPAAYTAMLLVMLALGTVGVRSFAAAFIVSWAVAPAILFILSTGEVRSAVMRPRVDWATARESWSIGRSTYFGSLAPVDALQLDVLLTTALLGATAAGLYYVATSAGWLVRVWGTTLGSLALPRSAGADSREDALDLMSLYARITVVVSGAVAGAIFVFARPLLWLVYGEAYVSAQLLVRILVVGMLAASIRYVIGDGMRGLGGHSEATRAEVLGWIVGGIALAVLVPKTGVIGVAAAVSVAYGTTLIATLLYARRFGVHPARLLVPTSGDFVRGWTVVCAALRRRG